MRVEKRFEEVLDLAIDLIKLSLDIFDHLLLRYGFNQFFLIALQLLGHLEGKF
jgi:hypothetical protein